MDESDMKLAEQLREQLEASGEKTAFDTPAADAQGGEQDDASSLVEGPFAQAMAAYRQAKRSGDAEATAAAIDADSIRDAEVGNPRHALHELDAARRNVVVHVADDRQDERKRRAARRYVAHGVMSAARQKADDECRCERQKEDGRQYWKSHQNAPPKMPSTRTA